MAPTKDRVKKHREKLKMDPTKWEEHKKKERERDKLRRLKLKENMEKSPRLKEEVKRKMNNRVKAHRERKKSQKTMLSVSNDLTVSPIGTYKCPQSFGKAVIKVKHVLPKSPHKKAAVLKKLVTDVIGSDFIEKSPSNKVQNTKKSISDEIKSCVTEFFCRDDISRQAPGIKDVKIIQKEGKKKTKIQKRHMVMTVGEAFSEFKKCFPEANVGKSVFYSLRPEHVLLVSETPHDVCVCKYHFNFISLLEAIHKGVPSIPKNHNELFEQLCCDSRNENCMYGLCLKCDNIINKLVSADADLTKFVTWKQWGDNANGRPILREESGAYDCALQTLSIKLSQFKKHCYVKKEQSEYFQKCKNEVAKDEAVMQMDFAENYALVSQDEIQSAHWSHSQVTLFTCCVWLPEKNIKSYVIVSNDKSHSKYSVYTFLKAILIEVQKLSPKMKKILIFSDNCAGQFKSRYTLSNLCFFETDFGLQVEWNFFSSSHGKGAMDGIGGTIKRNVWTAIKSRSVNINNAREFHDYVANTFRTKIMCFYIDKEIVEDHQIMLDKRWEKVKPILGIQACHSFRPYYDNCEDLLIAKTATSLMDRVTVFSSSDTKVPEAAAKRRLTFVEVYSSTESESSHEEDEFVDRASKECSATGDVEITEKDFVVIRYEGELFPGQVTEIKMEDNVRQYRIQCMVKSGTNWKWPLKPDEMFYTLEDICTKIDKNSVVPVSGRGVFKVTEPILQAKWLGNAE